MKKLFTGSTIKGKLIFIFLVLIIVGFWKLAKYRITDDGKVNSFTENGVKFLRGDMENYPRLKDFFGDETLPIINKYWAINDRPKQIQRKEIELRNGKVIPVTSQGNIFLSRIVFNKLKNKALVYMHDARYPRAERGYFVLVFQEEGNWVVKEFLLLWLS